ncbi:MAG: hypothetical protein AAF443_02370 [Chlamydiota bacterium]
MASAVTNSNPIINTIIEGSESNEISEVDKRISSLTKNQDFNPSSQKLNKNYFCQILCSSAKGFIGLAKTAGFACRSFCEWLGGLLRGSTDNIDLVSQEEAQMKADNILTEVEDELYNIKSRLENFMESSNNSLAKDEIYGAMSVFEVSNSEFKENLEPAFKSMQKVRRYFKKDQDFCNSLKNIKKLFKTLPKNQTSYFSRIKQYIS